MRNPNRGIAVFVLTAGTVAGVVSCSSSGSSGSGQSGSPTGSGSAAGISAAAEEAIQNCREILVTPERVGQVFGRTFEAPAPLEAGGVVLGCSYQTPGYEKGDGSLTVSVPRTSLRDGQAVTGWKYQAQYLPAGGGSLGTAGASLDVFVDGTRLRFSAGGRNLVADFPEQKMLTALETLAEQAITALND